MQFGLYVTARQAKETRRLPPQPECSRLAHETSKIIPSVAKNAAPYQVSETATKRCVSRWAQTSQFAPLLCAHYAAFLICAKHSPPSPQLFSLSQMCSMQCPKKGRSNYGNWF